MLKVHSDLMALLSLWPITPLISITNQIKDQTRAPIAADDTLPGGTLAHFDEQDQLQQVSIHSLVAGKKIIIIGVPGDFTPTCSLKHVSGFIEKIEELKSKGVAKILCLSGTFFLNLFGVNYIYGVQPLPQITFWCTTKILSH